MKKIVIGSLVVLTLLGCATEPQTRPGGGAFTQADAGPAPDRDRVILEYLYQVLKDPESARISNAAGPAFINVPGEMLQAGTYGWGICFWVNAKNSFGGYTGSRPFTLIWRNGTVQRAYGESRDNIFDRVRAENLCHSIRQAVVNHPPPSAPSTATGQQDWPKPADSGWPDAPQARPPTAMQGAASADTIAPRPFRPAACDWGNAKQGVGAC